MPTEFHSQVIFTKVPLGGSFKVEGEFQVYPLPIPDVPRKEGIKHFPCIIEYCIRDEDKKKIKNEPELSSLDDLSSLSATTYTKLDKLLMLLTALSNNLFFRYEDMGGVWGMPILDEDLTKLNTATSSWCLQMFHFPDHTPKTIISGFTNFDGPEIRTVPHQYFYSYEPNFDVDWTKNIILPTTLQSALQAYFSLDSATRTVVDFAMSYTASAVKLRSSQRTLSLLASFTGMETMVNLEFKDAEPERCSDCGQLKYSIARKFREYLLKYIGDSPANKKKFNAYYKLRSRIVHTGQQLKTEMLWPDIPNEEQHEERLLRYEILQLGKLAIANWLIVDFRKKQRVQRKQK